MNASRRAAPKEGGPAAGPRRARCPRCARPASLCLCPLIPLLRNRTPVTILQHPDETRHALNTARLAALGLADARLFVGERHAPEDWRLPGHDAWLLFPGDAALPLAELAARPPGPPVQLVVPDGTWRKAGALVRADPQLAALPRVALPPDLPGRYRIRKAPGPGALSTLEAVVHALNALDAPLRFDALLAPFEALIDGQIAAMGAETYRANYREPDQGRR